MCVKVRSYVSEREIISPQGVLERRERVLAILRLLKPLLYQFHIDLCSFDDADDGNINDTENNNYTIAYGAARHNRAKHETNDPTTSKRLKMTERLSEQNPESTLPSSPPTAAYLTEQFFQAVHDIMDKSLSQKTSSISWSIFRLCPMQHHKCNRGTLHSSKYCLTKCTKTRTGM